MNKKINNYISKYFLFFIIITQPILDIIAYFTFNDFLTPISFIVRSFYFVFIVIYSFVHIKEKKKMFLYILPFAIFCLIHLLNSYRLSGLNLFDDIRYMVLVMQMPIITISLCFYIKEHKEQVDYIEKGIFISLVIIAISVLISIITNTYHTTYVGYGITGWFTSANTQSMILSIITPLCLYYLFDKKNYAFIIGLIITFFLLYFNGTKACYYSLIALLFITSYLLIFNRKGKVKIFSTIIVLLVSIGLYNISFTSERNIDVQQNTEIRKNKIIELDKIDDFDNLSEQEFITVLKTSYLYKDMMKTFGEHRVYEELKNNFDVEDLSDSRLVKRTYAKMIFNDSDSLTKIVGFNHYEIEKYSMDLENDLTAIFYYYGYLGFIIYIGFFLYFIISALIVLIKNPTEIFSKTFVMLSTSLALGFYGAQYSGALLRKSNSNIYIAFILALFYIYLHSKLKQKKLKEDEVTILALHLGYGGVEKYISSLCKILQNDYKINLIVTYKLANEPAFAFDKKINIKYLIDDKPNKNEFKEALSSKNIISIVKEGYKSIKILILKKKRNIEEITKIDSKYIITTRDFHNSLVGKYAQKNIIKIATEHNYHNNNAKYIKNIIKSVKKMNYFVLVSENLYNFYNKKVNPECVFIPNVIDELPQKYTKLDQNNIVSIGRLEKEKGFNDLLDVISLVKKEIPTINLYLIGDGSLKKKLEKKVADNNLSDNVTFTGFISKKEIEKYLIKSKLFVMTSYTESFGLVLIEAMSYKVPCIAFDSANGANELLKNDVGILIGERDKVKMSKTIIELLNNQNKLKKISENGYQHCQKYLIDNVKKQWLDILNKK